MRKLKIEREKTGKEKIAGKGGRFSISSGEAMRYVGASALFNRLTKTNK